MNHAGIPAELQLLPQWVNWKYEKNLEGKEKKPLFNPKTGHKADHSDPRTWGTYAQAVERDPDHIGFVFTRECGYWGVDLDGCRDPETFAIEPWAREILVELKSYADKSPSGTGFHIICKGSLPVDGRRRGSIEVYSAHRYLTFTGDTLDHDHTVIEARDGGAFIKKHFAASDGQQVKVDFRNGKVRTKLPPLAEELLANPGGETHGGDRSAQDFACIVSLLKSGMSDSDAAATFIASPRGEDAKKRKPKLEYYIEHTIQSAREKLELKFDYHWLSESEVQIIEYLFPDFTIPRGMLTHLFGPKGTGKTKYMDRLTACATKQNMKVIRFNLEDAERAILLPCLHAAGADIGMVAIPGAIDGQPADFSQEGHLRALKRMITEIDAKLVIIEPIVDFKGKAKNNDTDAMKPIFMALAEVAQETGASIITVGHTNKKLDVSVLDKAMGDSSHVRVARVNIYMQRDSVEKELVHVMDAGSNIRVGKNLAFRIVEQKPFSLKLKNGEEEIVKNVAIAIIEDGIEDMSADEVLDESRTMKHSDAIAKFLVADLKGRGWVNTKLIMDACKKENIDWTWGNVKQIWSRRKLGSHRNDGGTHYWSVDPQLINGHDNTSIEIEPDVIDKKRLKGIM
jgi:AAA domain